MFYISLPKWAQEVYGSSVFNTIALNRFPAFTATTELKKLKSGFLLKDILDRFTEKYENTLSPNRSLWMYFGHKTTLINLLNTLGLYEPVVSSIFYPFEMRVFELIELFKIAAY